MHGQSLLCVDGCFCAWTVVSVHRQSFLNVGNCSCLWALVFICGQLFLYMGGHCECGQLFLNVGDWLHMWVVLGIGGVIVACGVLVLCLSWDKIWKEVLTVFYKKEWWILICCSSFGCHITDSDVALCALLVFFSCWGLLWLCRACIGRHGVWTWVSTGDGRRCVWMCHWHQRQTPGQLICMCSAVCLVDRSRPIVLIAKCE